MAVIRTYHCPGCQCSVSPRIGLILKPFVQCSKCPTRVYVSRDMVIDNWTRSIYLQSALAIWLALTVRFLILPPQAGQTHSPVGVIIGMLLIGWLPALICAIPLMPIGYVLGHIASYFVAQGPPQLETTWPSRFGSGYVPKDHQWR